MLTGAGAGVAANRERERRERNSIIVDQFQIANIYIQLVMPCGNKTRAINLSNSKVREHRERGRERANENAISLKYHLIHIQAKVSRHSKSVYHEVSRK